MTTIYSTTMAVATFTPPLVAVPVADAAGWRLSLGHVGGVRGRRDDPVDRAARPPARGGTGRGHRDRQPAGVRAAVAAPARVGAHGRRSPSRAPSRTRRSPGCRRCWSTPRASRRRRPGALLSLFAAMGLPASLARAGARRPLQRDARALRRSPSSRASRASRACSSRPRRRRGCGSPCSASRRCCSRSRSCCSACASARTRRRSR